METILVFHRQAVYSRPAEMTLCRAAQIGIIDIHINEKGQICGYWPERKV